MFEIRCDAERLEAAEARVRLAAGQDRIGHVHPVVERRGVVIPAELDAALAATQGDAPRPAVADLTPREGEILEMIELGLSNKEIARDLRIEVGTVKNHVHNILEKLNVRRRNQAARHLRVRSPPL